MPVMLGNLDVSNIEKRLGIALKENDRERKRGSGVGLVNVHNRIKLRFGQQYGLIIESHPDEGMLVRIHIPFVPFTEETQKLLDEGKLPKDFLKEGEQKNEQK